MPTRRRVITISAAGLAAAATLVSACTPVINNLVDHLWPGTKPVPLLPVQETPSEAIHAAPAPAAEPAHESLPDRDLPY